MKMVYRSSNSPSNVQASFPTCILRHNQLKLHSRPTTLRTSPAFQQDLKSDV